MYTITITEEDRQKADRFTNIYDCLVMTAIKRLGILIRHCGTEGATEFTSDGLRRLDFSERLDAKALFVDHSTQVRPFYGPEVVGKTITLE